MKYFSVKLEEAHDPAPGSISTCALRVCMVCGIILSTRGGPGKYMCEECEHEIHTGKIMRLVRSYRGMKIGDKYEKN